MAAVSPEPEPDEEAGGKNTLKVHAPVQRDKSVYSAHAPSAVRWQWKHSSGFKDYGGPANRRIEEAYQHGYTYVRVKATSTGSVPVEIFFDEKTQYDPISGHRHQVRRLGPDPVKQKFLRALHRRYHWAYGVLSGRPTHMALSHHEQERQHLWAGIESNEHNTDVLFRETGCCARVARSRGFFFFSTGVIVAQAVWLGLDAHYNDADTIYDADLGFKVVENLFCAFFAVELVIRFVAFRDRKAALKKFWFLFDTVLAMLMVGETWFLPLFLHWISQDGPSRGGWNVFRLARILKVARIGRMVHLLRVFPELLTLTQGILHALRSVLFTVVLLLLLLYIFGIVFTIQAKAYDDPVLEKYFGDVLASMWVMGMQGILLDGPTAMLDQVKQSSRMLTALFIIFIFISSFTILNMLIGILCTVVDQVYQEGREGNEVEYLRSTLDELLSAHSEDDNRYLRKREFEMLMQNPEAHVILARFGVNSNDLIQMKDSLFEYHAINKEADMSAAGSVTGASAFVAGQPVPGQEAERGEDGQLERELTFAEFISTVLRLRGGNNAKVTDVVDLREYIKMSFDRHKEFLVRCFPNMVDLDINSSMPGARHSVPAWSLRPRLDTDDRVPEVRALPQALPQARPQAAEQNGRFPETALPGQVPSGSTASVGPATAEAILAQLATLQAGQQQLLRRQEELEAQQLAWQQRFLEAQSLQQAALDKVLAKLHTIP